MVYHQNSSKTQAQGTSHRTVLQTLEQEAWVTTAASDAASLTAACRDYDTSWKVFRNRASIIVKPVQLAETKPLASWEASTPMGSRTVLSQDNLKPPLISHKHLLLWIQDTNGLHSPRWLCSMENNMALIIHANKCTQVLEHMNYDARKQATCFYVQVISQSFRGM